jgi:hypothetical protein
MSSSRAWTLASSRHSRFSSHKSCELNFQTGSNCAGFLG